MCQRNFCFTFCSFLSENAPFRILKKLNFKIFRGNMLPDPPTNVPYGRTNSGNLPPARVCNAIFIIKTVVFLNFFYKESNIHFSKGCILKYVRGVTKFPTGCLQCALQSATKTKNFLTQRSLIMKLSVTSEVVCQSLNSLRKPTSFPFSL